jgi:ElaB/YqjD/DUF883 family membrane-anchored ribosome-binding protein
MGANPDQLTDEIAATRGRMTDTVDDIRERVSPRQAIERRAESAREAVADGGSAVVDQARHAADEAQGRGRRMMHAASETAREKPLLTGLAALGAGMLVGALAPASDTERRAARHLKSDLQEPVREAAADSAHQVGDAVQARAGEAVDHVRDEAQQAVDETKAESAEAVDAARDRAEHAAEHVRDDVQRRF